jgi:hypothetical protein
VRDGGLDFEAAFHGSQNLAEPSRPQESEEGISMLDVFNVSYLIQASVSISLTSHLHLDSGIPAFRFYHEAIPTWCRTGSFRRNIH